MSEILNNYKAMQENSSEIQISKRSSIPKELFSVYYNGIDGNSLQKYDLVSDTWKCVAAIHRNKKVDMGCICVHDQIYLFGGRCIATRRLPYESLVQSVNVHTGELRNLKPLISRKVAMSVVYLNNQIFVCGGSSDDSMTLTSVEK